MLLIADIARAAPSDEIVVEGDRAPDPAATSASLTVLDLGPDLPPAQDLASVLATASGATVRRLGGLGDFAAVSLRGSSFRQVEVFLDGVPLNPDGSSVVNLAELPASAFSRVEVYRGNAPVSFGSAAMGGVVNLVTPDAGPVPTSFAGAGGSWGTARAHAVAGPSAAGVDTFLAVEQLHTEGDWDYFDDRGTEFNLYDDRTETRANNAVDRSTALARARFGPSHARVTVLDSFVRGHQELAGDISNPATSASLGTQRNLAVIGAELRPTDTSGVSPRAWWLWRQEELDDRGGEIGVGTQWTRDTWHTGGAQLDARWRATRWLGATATARFRHERYTPYDRLAEAEDGSRVRNGGGLAVAADAYAWRERVTVTPAVHLVVSDNRLLGDVPYQDLAVAPEAEDTDLWVLPRLGVLVRPLPWVALKANGGRYARPPDLTELFGDHGSLVGNTDLVAEEGWAWDVGARIEAPDNRWATAALDVAYARNYAQDLIVWVQNSQYSARAENVGKAYVRTTEAALSVDAFGFVRSASNVTWTLSRNLLEAEAYANNELPRVPAVELAQATTVYWRDAASLTHTWSYTSATFTDTANYFATAPRDLHGLAVTIAPSPRLPTLSAEVLNLFDVRGAAVDRDPLNEEDDTLVVKPLADFANYPLPGRTVMVAVSWTDRPRGDSR